MDTSLKRILSRLDQSLLTHLQAHCVEQAARIDELEAQVARLTHDLTNAEMAAEMWHQLALDMTTDASPQISITRDGQVGVLQGTEPIASECKTGLVDHMEEPTHRVLGARRDERYPTAGNFLLDELLDGHQTADIGCLDAPDFIPAGSHIAVTPAGSYYTYVQPTYRMRGVLA